MTLARVAAFVSGSAQSAAPQVIVESPALQAGQPIPKQYTADGTSISPPLTWRNLPRDTNEIVVACIDQNEIVPHLAPFLHWVVYGLPPALVDTQIRPLIDT